MKRLSRRFTRDLDFLEDMWHLKATLLWCSIQATSFPFKWSALSSVLLLDRAMFRDISQVTWRWSAANDACGFKLWNMTEQTTLKSSVWEKIVQIPQLIKRFFARSLSKSFASRFQCRIYICWAFFLQREMPQLLCNIFERHEHCWLMNNRERTGNRRNLIWN